MVINQFNGRGDDISLSTIVKFIDTNKNIIFFSILFVIILGVSYLFIYPKKYEATINIQVAKVANSEIETPQMLLEKLKIPSYYSNATLQICRVEDEREPRMALIEKLKPSLNKTTPIIVISYREKAVDTSKKCLESVLSDIRANQADIIQPVIEVRKNELAKNKLKLEELEQNLKQIFSLKNMNFNFTDEKFSASSLLFSTLLSKEGEAKDLRTAIRNLEIALSEPQTKQSDMITPIYSSGLAVEPRPLLVMIISIFLCCFVAITYLILRQIIF